MRRHMLAQQEAELKAFTNAQKKEYKHNKEKAKAVNVFNTSHTLLLKFFLH